MDELSGGSRICVISDDGQPSDLRSAIADRARELSEMDAAALLAVLDGSADTRWVLHATDIPVNRT